MILKTIIFPILCIFSGFSVSLAVENNHSLKQVSKWHQAAIGFVINESAKKIHLSHAKLNEIAPLGQAELRQKFVIPFVSIKQYMKLIISDKMYVPREALKITTHAGSFGLWEDERGIQMSHIENDPFGENCVESILAKNRLCASALLTLKINKMGHLSLSI